MISVIIPHYNSTGSLKKLLNSLQQQKTEQVFEVIVVVNPEEKYTEFPTWKFNFSLVWDKSLAGANRARQKGVSRSHADILLFLDDDCEILDPRFIQKHADHHLDQNISGVGGRYQLSGKTSLLGRVYNKLQNDWLQSHRLPGGYNMHLLGGNSSFKKAVFMDESYDENIVFGGTETELQVRLHQRKHKLKLFEDLNIQHDGYLGFSDFLTKSFKQGIGAAYISQKHRRPPKFLFADGEKAPLSVVFRLAEWLYKTSFEAGRRHFVETGDLKVPRSLIYKKILRMVPQKIFAKEFFLWRESRTLSHVISKEILSLPRKNESHPVESPGSDLHKS